MDTTIEEVDEHGAVIGPAKGIDLTPEEQAAHQARIKHFTETGDPGTPHLAWTSEDRRRSDERLAAILERLDVIAASTFTILTPAHTAAGHTYHAAHRILEEFRHYGYEYATQDWTLRS